MTKSRQLVSGALLCLVLGVSMVATVASVRLGHAFTVAGQLP
jgi:hypothetical protein